MLAGDCDATVDGGTGNIQPAGAAAAGERGQRAKRARRRGALRHGPAAAAAGGGTAPDPARHRPRCAPQEAQIWHAIDMRCRVQTLASAPADLATMYSMSRSRTMRYLPRYERRAASMQLFINPRLHLGCRCAGAGILETGTGTGLCEHRLLF